MSCPAGKRARVVRRRSMPYRRIKLDPQTSMTLRLIFLTRPFCSGPMSTGPKRFKGHKR